MVREEKLGKVKHFFAKIMVAVLEIESDIKVGQDVRFESEITFEQRIDSMQMKHESVQEAKAGDQIGVKVDGKVARGDYVYKIYD